MANYQTLVSDYFKTLSKRKPTVKRADVLRAVKTRSDKNVKPTVWVQTKLDREIARQNQMVQMEREAKIEEVLINQGLMDADPNREMREWFATPRGERRPLQLPNPNDYDPDRRTQTTKNLVRTLLELVVQDDTPGTTLRVGDKFLTVNAARAREITDMIDSAELFQEGKPMGSRWVGSDVEVLFTDPTFGDDIELIQRDYGTGGYKTRKGGFFRYWNRCKGLDLSRYGIFRDIEDYKKQLRLSNRSKKLMNCAIHSLKCGGIMSEEDITAVAGRMRAQEIPMTTLGKLVNDVGYTLHVYSYRERKNGVKTSSIERFKVEDAPVIKLAMIGDHYLPYDEHTGVYAKAISEYDDVVDDVGLNSWWQVQQQNRKGGYYRNRTGKFSLNSLKLVHMLLEYQEKFLEPITADGGLLECAVRYGQNVEIRNLQYRRDMVRPFARKMIDMEESAERDEKRTVFMADFETFVGEDGDMVPYQGACREVDAKDELKVFHGRRCAAEMLSYMTRGREWIGIYFHNASFDCNFLVDRLYGISTVRKGSTTYSMNGYFNKVRVDIRCTYLHTAMTLDKFAQSMKVPVRKGVFPYGMMTQAVVDAGPRAMVPLVDAEKYTKSDKDWKRLQKDAQPYVAVVDGTVCFDILAYSENYLRLDVETLRQAFVKLRELYATAPAFCINIYDFLTTASLADYVMSRGPDANGYQEGVEPDYKPCYEGVNELSGHVREFIAKSCAGGRTMVANNCAEYVEDEIACADANSLYPSAIAQLPSFPTGAPEVIDDDELNMSALSGANSYFVEVEIRRTPRFRDIPVVAVKLPDGRVQYTNIGEPESLEATLERLERNLREIEAEDIDALLEVERQQYVKRVRNRVEGPCTIVLNHIQLEDLVKYAECREGVDFDIKRGYKFIGGGINRHKQLIEKLYEMRLAQKKNPMEQLLKLCLNCIYGKCLLKEPKSKWVIMSNKETVERETDEEEIEAYYDAVSNGADPKAHIRTDEVLCYRSGAQVRKGDYLDREIEERLAVGEMVMEKKTILVEHKASDFTKFMCKNHASVIQDTPIGESGSKSAIELRLATSEHFNRCHIASLVLAMSKRIMTRSFDAMQNVGARVLYTDTDSSFMLSKDMPRVEAEYLRREGSPMTDSHATKIAFAADPEKTEQDLEEALVEPPKALGRLSGDLKIDGCKNVSGAKGIFVGKKFYAVAQVGQDKETGKWVRADKLRGKGVPSPAITDAAQRLKTTEMGIYERMFKGEEIYFDMRAGQRANMRLGNNYKVRIAPNSKDKLTGEKMDSLYRSVSFAHCDNFVGPWSGSTRYEHRVVSLEEALRVRNIPQQQPYGRVYAAMPADRGPIQEPLRTALNPASELFGADADCEESSYGVGAAMPRLRGEGGIESQISNPATDIVCRVERGGRNQFAVFQDFAAVLDHNDGGGPWTAHELVPAARAQRLRLDVDMPDELLRGTDWTKGKAMRMICTAVRDTYHEFWRDEIGDSELVICETPRGESKKYSWHLSVRGRCVSGSEQARHFARRVQTRVGPVLARAIDHGIYTDMHGLRVVGTHKPGEPDRVKRVIPARVEAFGHRDADTRLCAAEDDKLLCDICPRPTRARRADTTERYDGLPEAVVHKLRELKLLDAHTYRCTRGLTIEFNRIAPSFCEICRRRHDHDNTLMVKHAPGSNHMSVLCRRNVRRGRDYTLT